MEESLTVPAQQSNNPHANEKTTSETKEENVRVLSVDKITVEKIVLEKPGSKEVLLKKSESQKKVSEFTRRIPTRSRPDKWARRDKRGSNHIDAFKKKGNGSFEKLNDNPTIQVKVPIGKIRRDINSGKGTERKIIPVKYKSTSLANVAKSYKSAQNANLSIVQCKTPPPVLPKPIKEQDGLTQQISPSSADTIKDDRNNSERDEIDGEKLTLLTANAHARLENSQSEIERLQKNLAQIDSTTAEVYKRKLPILHSQVLRVSPIPHVDLNENIKRTTFDQEFLAKYNYNGKLKIEERALLETDFDCISGTVLSSGKRLEQPRWSKEVCEVEKRWSGEYLDNHRDRNSSESSKSSYVEELGSISSHESIVQDQHGKTGTSTRNSKLDESDEYLKTTEGSISTVDSNSCIEDRIKSVDEDIQKDFEEEHKSSESKESTLKDTSSIKSCQEIEETADTSSDELQKDINEEKASVDAVTLVKERNRKVIVTEREQGVSPTFDGYAELIKEITMEPSSSKGKDEKKKKSGLRRLLPGFFSPKDHKKEQKERKRRDERHFSQHQQNGIYTRSPDTMNLNEDIKHNVNLDTSLNGSIIEERLNEIKQELFPDQGMTTSTPDHFLQDRTYQDRITPRIYTAHSSLSSIAVDDKWMDQNIISGSPDMRKIKQQAVNEARKCNLVRKHSLQEEQPRFLRNHGPSGRISAPPSERYLLRPRAIHPIDRPLPAIPQKVEFSNYQNQQEIAKHELYMQNHASINYQGNIYYPGNQNYKNGAELYENNKTEISKNQSIDSGFNLTPVSNQAKTNHQFLVPQNDQKLGINIARSPKYSPSSSQRSGDYADSSYTPNSSQKSEFSPGSSKSGEYYLSSPRDSCGMSPDTSFNKDQLDNEKSLYQNPQSDAKGSMTEEHLYDEAPRSLSVSPRQTHNSSIQEVMYMRGSPNIPMSTNLAKLRSNVESPKSPEGKMKSPSIPNSPIPQTSTTVQDGGETAVNSISDEPREYNRITSPLIILTPERNVSSGQHSRSYIKHADSSHMSTFQPRKAQPNDQILIASPKREPIYEERSPSKMQPRSVNSPIPMADSPSQVLPGRQNLQQMVANKLERKLSPQVNSMGNQSLPSEPEPQRSLTQSPTIQANSMKLVQQPDPIYMKKQSPEAKTDMLLIQTVPGKTSSHTNNDLVANEPNQQPDQVEVTPPRLMRPQARREVAVSSDDQESLQLRKRNPSPGQERPQPIYDDRHQSSERLNVKRIQPSPIPSEMNQMSHVRLNQSIYSTKHEVLNQEPIYGSQGMTREQIYAQRNLSEKQQSPYGWRVSEPIYAQQANKPLSPSKRQTLQHLEAFYWQQKALECQRASANSPTTSNRSQELKPGQPEVREAINWQQLKKLNDEQQRKIFERNQFEEYNEMMKNKSQIPCPSPSSVPRDQSESIYGSQQKVVTKPPVPGQKGQNQPIQIVRPQQTVRNSDHSKNIRLTSSPPHFVRNDERRSLQLPRRVTSETDDAGVIPSAKQHLVEHKLPSPHQICEDNEERRMHPPPIFKRGSLISNSSNSVEYGTMGTKRVSFSNQCNSPEIGSGNWPTKHGMAPEPPTRRNRTEDKISGDNNNANDISTNDRVQEENQNNVNSNAANAIYGNTGPGARDHIIHETEYDAKPLPPLPPVKEVTVNRSNSMRDNRHENTEVPRVKVLTNPIRCLGVSESESGSEAGEIQRILHRRNEEEWNSSGKGRQSNDTGGSGRAEGEGGSNDLPGGRRSGGIGVLANVGVGRSSGTGGGGGRSRDEPRRHTLSGDHAPSLHHQPFNVQPLHPLHPHHLPTPHGQYGTPPRHGTMDLEMGTKSRQRKSPFPRGYPPPSSAMLFDDDPGIMSEVETSSTGFRRGGKQRSSLPVVRTPSKTLERPLGLVFLQYRKETKRALLPNEITSIDTVKALFVRSFPKQLTMEYLDSPDVKVYIHDSNKDMFYELEDHRSHLRDIRDRSVLRLIEKSDIAGIPPMQGVPVGGQGLPPHWEDQSYFSEPEFDSEFQHQHIHKSKAAKNSTSGNYYMGGSSTLPRGGPIMRAYSPAAPAVLAGPNATPTQPKTLGTPDRLHGESDYMSSPERGGGGGGVGAGIGRYPTYSTQSSYEEPYYSQYSGTVTPVIDEEARIRVEHMERQLANLTGLVQKALTHAPHPSPSPRDYLQVPAGRDPYARSADKSVSFEKSVSFSDEPPDMNSPKQHSPQHAERDRHKPNLPPKPVALAAGGYVYRDLALTPEMYNQLRGLQKKAKDLRQEVRNLRRMSQAQAHTVRETIKDTFQTIRAMLLSGGDAAWAAGDSEKIRLSREEDLYKQEMLRLEKDLTELESTVEELRGNVINRKTRVNMSDVENMALILSKSSKTVADLKVRFPSLQEGMKGLLSSEMEKVVREEKFLKEEPERLESALRRCKKLTGTLVTLKRLASVQEQRLPNAVSLDSEETPPITPTSAQHSKTTAPVPAERTLMGSTSLIGGGPHSGESSTTHQQRPENALDALLDELQTFSRPSSQLSQVSNTSQSTNHMPTMLEIGRSSSQIVQSVIRPPNMSEIGRKGSIDSSSSLAIIPPGTTLRRLHSYPSSSDTDTSPPIARIQVSDGSASTATPTSASVPTGPPPPPPPQKPPVPERNAELLQLATARRVPPPPPPRTSSKSPLASPTSPQLPPRNPTTATLRRNRSNAKETGKPPMALPPGVNSETGESTQCQTHQNNILSTSNSSSCESINSQEGLQNKKGRQEQLEQRHQELLRKQKALQEQYARLQQLQRNTSGLAAVPPTPPDLLKKTGSESNLLAKMGLSMSAANSGSLTSLAATKNNNNEQAATITTTTTTTMSNDNQGQNTIAPGNLSTNQTTTSKIYETDIL